MNPSKSRIGRLRRQIAFRHDIFPGIQPSRSEEQIMHPALQSLPHGPSFRFVDSLTDLDPGRSGSGTYLVKGTEDFLSGHFPEQPLMPGVLLIEAVAQLGGVVAQSHPDNSPLRSLKLAAVQQAKITGSAVPGETVALHAAVLGRQDALVLIEGTATAGGRIILTTRLTLSGERPD
jgi:3-hydroxyacyl-[acyl-carrier-protein] dehydratase